MDIGESCKYCSDPIQYAVSEGLKCTNCQETVHLKCLRMGSVPGGLSGDTFFCYTCQECSPTETEVFARDKMPWMQAIVLVLFHMQNRTPGLARKGFFHWKIHIATFIDKQWDVLFSKDFKRKKKWMGTISGTLSHYSPHIFHSGTALFSDQGWWTLTYPKLSPGVIVQLNSEVIIRKQKNKEQHILITDADLFEQILLSKTFVPRDFLTKVSIITSAVVENVESSNGKPEIEFINVKEEIPEASTPEKYTKRASLLPSMEKLYDTPPKKLFKSNKSQKNSSKDNLSSSLLGNVNFNNDDNASVIIEKTIEENVGNILTKFLDPFCYYNTCLNDITKLHGVPMNIKLTGGLREEPILSPYSSLYLKPYIRRDVSACPLWLQVMAEILVRTNRHKTDWLLPPRGPLDYVYVQPSHIPAINSICNQFFWPGIDLTESLQYPDFSCVVLYRKLIVGFAFVVPDVKFNENYISFVFTRPGWRNVGVGKFMIYHLIQTSTGKDLTLHVSINNPALLLYQKFGFKVEHVELNFYNKYLRRDTLESKHAFFCRLER